MEATIFAPSLEGMKHVRSEIGEMLTKPFLDVCKLILPVLDNFGAAMAIVKTDIGENITRLETKYNSNPVRYNCLYSMVKEEMEAKTAKSSTSCTNGLLWLTRSMPQVCTDSYAKTLKKFYGWLASSAFTVAMKLAPDRKKFMEVISKNGDVKEDMQTFCETFRHLLKNHRFLASIGLDDLRAS